MRNWFYYMVLFLSLTFPATVRAQSVSVNVDAKTIATMSEAFSTESAMEALHNENLQKIYDSYKAAEVATAGIFASKYLDRNALTNLDVWNSHEENRYYTRIYNIVSKRILPKLLICARLMIKDPSTALYWGSYLLKTCADVKSLCSQFESIVTNSTLSFQDIAFVQISEQLSGLFNLSGLGGVDWKDMFEHLGDDIENAATIENVKMDLDNLINKGVGLASAGFSGAVDNLMQGTSFDGSFQHKISSIISMADNAMKMYDQFKDASATQILSSLAGEDALGQLFNLSDYNLTSWLTDYESASQGQYYTQRVFIYRMEQGEELLCNYQPPSDTRSIMEGPHWYRIQTTDPVFAPNPSQVAAIQSNSEAMAGVSHYKELAMKEHNEGNTYTIMYVQRERVLKAAHIGQYGKAYAYEIEARRSWNRKEEVYQEVFDSYSMEWNTFMAQMNARLSQYNANGDHADITTLEELEAYTCEHREEPRYIYYIGYGEKRDYQATDAKKISGALSATFSLTCHGGGSLGDGAFSYKCNTCGRNLSEHTKQCCMLSTLEEGSFDTSDLYSRLETDELEATSMQAELDELNKRNSELLRIMANTDDSTIYKSSQQEYNANKGKISELERQLKEKRHAIEQTKAAIEAAEEDARSQTDDYNRLPQVMMQMENAYGIKWQDSGSWSGYTFIRKGTIGNMEGVVTFQATLSIARAPQYFLGIKIHRAIVQVDWALSSEWSDSSVAEIMELDASKSDDENAALVNHRLSELAIAYPQCDVSVEYTKQPGIETEENEGTYHLLWASDRLEIARQIEARLARIYTDLCMIEKFLHYKHGIIDWVRDLVPNLSTDEGRKMTIAERCRRRWLHNGGSNKYEEEMEDDNYEEE